MNGVPSFVEMCIHDAKPEKIEEFERLLVRAEIPP
jgi:hypothetical protein